MIAEAVCLVEFGDVEQGQADFPLKPLRAERIVCPKDQPLGFFERAGGPIRRIPAAFDADAGIERPPGDVHPQGGIASACRSKCPRISALASKWERSFESSSIAA